MVHLLRSPIAFRLSHFAGSLRFSESSVESGSASPALPSAFRLSRFAGLSASPELPSAFRLFPIAYCLLPVPHHLNLHFAFCTLHFALFLFPVPRSLP